MTDRGVDSPDRSEKAAQAQLLAMAEIEDFIWLMSDKRGRRIVWRLLGEAGVFKTSYQPGMDAMQTAFNEGGRNQGVKLMAWITQHCPDRFSEMQKEAQNHVRRSTSRTRDASSPGR